MEEFHDRIYRSGRQDFHAGIDRLVEKVRCSTVQTFRLIEAIQFSSPWKRRSRDVGCA